MGGPYAPPFIRNYIQVCLVDEVFQDAGFRIQWGWKCLSSDKWLLHLKVEFGIREMYRHIQRGFRKSCLAPIISGYAQLYNIIVHHWS